MSTDISNQELITFKSLVSFIEELNKNFTSNHSLNLYARLISKTTLKHTKIIKKHIELFKSFCISNRDAIYSKDYKLIKQRKISYSDNVFINFDFIFERADKDSQNVIWEHLLTISALTDPTGKAKEILKNNENTTENNFLNDILKKVESNCDLSSNKNPFEAINSMLSSGVFTDILSKMTTELDSGKLDLNSLISTTQNLCSNMGLNTNENMNISNLLSGFTKNGEMPDLNNLMSNLLKPGNTTTQQIVEEIEDKK
jgi:hypothetical protein